MWDEFLMERITSVPGVGRATVALLVTKNGLDKVLGVACDRMAKMRIVEDTAKRQNLRNNVVDITPMTM